MATEWCSLGLRTSIFEHALTLYGPPKKLVEDPLPDAKTTVPKVAVTSSTVPVNNQETTAVPDVPCLVNVKST